MQFRYFISGPSLSLVNKELLVMTREQSRAMIAAFDKIIKEHEELIKQLSQISNETSIDSATYANSKIDQFYINSMRALLGTYFAASN